MSAAEIAKKAEVKADAGVKKTAKKAEAKKTEANGAKKVEKAAPPAAKKVRFLLDCTKPFHDNIIDPSGLRKFFIDKIKVDGKTSNFEKLNRKTGVVEKVVKVGGLGPKITIEATQPFKKRYIKYLTKRYLKKQLIRDFLRVVATNKTSYVLKYYRLKNADDD